MSPEDESLWCKKIFGDIEWSKSEDANTISLIEEVLKKAEKDMKVVLCVGSPTSTRTVASSHVHWEFFQQYFFISFDNGFLATLHGEKDPLEGIIAHEVAHRLTKGGMECKMHFFRGMVREYILCESAVDKAGGKLVGVEKVATGLQAVADFVRVSQEQSKTMIDAGVGMVLERIRLLRASN